MDKIQKKKLIIQLITGAIITAILGTLAHFAYEWSGNNRLVGLITAVNESTWEHMKLLFFPILLISIVLVLRLKESYPCILPALLTGTLLGTFLIPVLFYTYSGILGQTIDAINIGIYYICVLAAFCVTYRLTLKGCSKECTNLLLLVTFVMVLLFFIFTYYPLEIGIFENPERMLKSRYSLRFIKR